MTRQNAFLSRGGPGFWDRISLNVFLLKQGRLAYPQSVIQQTPGLRAIGVSMGGNNIGKLIAEVMGRPVALRHFDPALLKAFDNPGPFFGQNLVYDCHAVHTSGKLRTELGIRPTYTLAGGLRQTWEWYRAQGALDRPLDTTFEDALLAKLGA